MSVEQFRAALGAMCLSDLPTFINRNDYRPDLGAMWALNPARAFLRLTDADQRKVLQYLGGDNA